MTQRLLDQAASIYTLALVGSFAVVALWESWRPLRSGTVPLARRWLQNLGLYAIDQGLLRSLPPVMALGAATMAEARGWGLLPALGVPAALALLAAILLMDGLRWAMHRAFHRVDLLWRLHRVHHSDLDLDASSSQRFHPLEALLLQAGLVGAVLAVGVPPLAVLLCDVLTLAVGTLAHGNVALPGRLDSALRRVIVTPSLHHIHHSMCAEDSQANYGVLLSCWDRLAGSYRETADKGAAYGLPDLRDPRWLTLWRLLWLPLRSRAA